jgi:hypothetical protein
LSDGISIYDATIPENVVVEIGIERGQ